MSLNLPDVLRKADSDDSRKFMHISNARSPVIDALHESRTSEAFWSVSASEASYCSRHHSATYATDNDLNNEPCAYNHSKQHFSSSSPVKPERQVNTSIDVEGIGALAATHLPSVTGSSFVSNHEEVMPPRESRRMTEGPSRSCRGDQRSLKRRRTSSDNPHSPRYASESAAIRKARSLRSDILYVTRRLASPQQMDSSMPKQPYHSSGISSHDPGSSSIPTAPATRLPTPSPSRSPSPVILPVPETHPFPIFLSPDEQAERRLVRLLEREGRSRKMAGFKDYKYLRNRASLARTSHLLAEPHSDDEDEDACTQEFRIGIDANLREEVIGWMLTVIPKRGSSGQASWRNLRDQLMSHPDTSFLSVYLFAQYLWIVSPDESKKLEISRGKQVDVGGTRAVAYDLALAALAVSVKYHRDFLYPLAPISAQDFMAMARRKISFQDFELAQRDILLGLLYDLSMPTPQAILDELREALPLLRRALPQHRWTLVLQDVWWQLLHAVREPDMFRWPISLLTVAAIRESLVRMNGDLQCTCERPTVTVEAICQDIREVLCYSEVSDAMLLPLLVLYFQDAMQECEGWLEQVRKAATENVSPPSLDAL